MAHRASSWLGMIAGVVSIAWGPELCRAQQDKPTVAQILQVWKKRQEKVATARFELSCEDTIHKGSNSFLNSHRRLAAGLAAELEPNPPRDYLVEGKSSISLDGSKLRYSYDRQQWDPIGKKLYPEHYINVFDGRLLKFLRNPASGQKDYPSAGIRKVEKSESALQFSLLPLIFTFRGNHPQFFQNLQKFQVAGQMVVVGGRPCLELVHAANSADSREVLYLDQERHYVVVRRMILVDGQPDWQLDITYNADAVVGWIPRSWEHIIRVGKDHLIIQSGRVAVTHYEINSQMDDNEFDVSFPPRTRVTDESSGVDVEYIIRENGEKGRAIPTADNPTYEQLQFQRAARQGSRGKIVWATILVLALGGLIWIQLRRMRREKHGPQQP